MKDLMKMCITLTLIGAACAALLAFVNSKTSAVIEEKKGGAKLEAAKEILPAFDNKLARDTVVLNDGSRDIVYYRARKGKALVGVAFEAVSANGYSGEISMLVGVDTSGSVTGIKILKHLETPGLGAKIETPEFLGQFIGASRSKPEVWAVKKDGGTFDQITGATISSRAVTEAIARGLEFLEKNRNRIFGN